MSQNNSAASAPDLSSSNKNQLEALRHALQNFLSGKDSVSEAILCSLIASGHVLFEDVPGVGKTTLVKGLAKLLGLKMSRIQCTSDLLPSDILGVEVFQAKENEFVFHPGPLFSSLVLVDELNRASPRTQSALLEAMAEGSVSLNRKQYPLPAPFLVFATQNPSDSLGTYQLPESQLDRFAVKLRLDYPSTQRECEILRAAARDPLETLAEGVIDLAGLQSLQLHSQKIFVAERVAEYAKRVIDASRTNRDLRLGVSTRGGVTWVRLARARALCQGRGFLTPDDLRALAEVVLCHRIVPRAGGDARPALLDILETTPID